MAGRVLILSISGRIGNAAAPALRAALADADDTAAAVIVDLSDVDYLSGPGVAALHAGAAAAHGSFIVCGVSGPVQIALELAGVLTELGVEPTRAAALERAERRIPLR